LSPLSPIVHLVAIAAGLWGGFMFMGWASPDLPNPDTNPALRSAATPEQVSGGDSNSLLRAGPLSVALDQLSDQLGAGEDLRLMQIVPGRIDTSSSGSGTGFSVDDVEPQAPERILAVIASQRPSVRGLEDVQFMQLRAQLDAPPTWYVQLSLEIDPPRTYTAALDGSNVQAGG
jgi:hypothetical protein